MHKIDMKNQSVADTERLATSQMLSFFFCFRFYFPAGLCRRFTRPEHQSSRRVS